MTVPVTNAYSTGTGNGTATAFPFTFFAETEAEIAVYLGGTLQGAGYTVVVNAGGAGGTVTFTAAPANGVAVIIASNPSFTQSTSFANAGAYLPASHDTALDRAAARDIYLKGEIDRTPKVPIGQTPPSFPSRAGLANKYLRGDENGNLIPVDIDSGLTRFTDPRDLGAVADGVTDDAAALQTALNTGKRVWIHPELTYAFGSPLLPPSGGGFVGGGKLLMLTGTGKFDHADYTGNVLTYSGIVAEGLGDIRIEARIEMQANAGVRCCNPIWIRNCTDVHLDVECWGFKETRYGIVEWNSNMGGSVKLYAHDCNPNSNTLPSMQVTGLSVDSNRYDPGTGSVNSRRLRFDVNAVNLELGATAVAQYGYQTDGVNLQGSGFGGHIGRVVTENVDEPLDCWSDGNIVDVAARDCFWGVKLIYGASNNNIRATVDTYRKAGVVYAGAVAGQKATAYNRVNITATGGGTIGTEGDVAGVRFEDPTGVFEANSNFTEITVHGDGANLDYGAHIKSGSSNIVRIIGDGYAVSESLITSTGTGNNVGAP